MGLHTHNDKHSDNRGSHRHPVIRVNVTQKYSHIGAHVCTGVSVTQSRLCSPSFAHLSECVCCVRNVLTAVRIQGGLEGGPAVSVQYKGAAGEVAGLRDVCSLNTQTQTRCTNMYVNTTHRIYAYTLKLATRSNKQMYMRKTLVQTCV